MSTSAEAALQRQLMDVESAIATLKTRQEEGIAVTSMELPITRQVYKIDTSIKRVACPVCFEDVLESGLRHHMANACVGIEVECPAVGCRQRMPASELKIHMDHKCPVAKRRKWLARQAKTREAEQQVLEAKRQEDTLLKRRAAELERSRLRRHRWPPPSVEDSNESLRPIGADDGVKDVPMDSEKGTEPPVENAITV